MKPSPVLSSPLTMSAFLKGLEPGSRLLDLGCGVGTLRYRELPHLEIQAVDEKVPTNLAEFPPNARFVQESASSLSMADGTFEAVVANFSFEHFPDPEASLREIDRVTKDRGRAWISIPDASSFEDQLYRNLYAGGGHLQQPGLAWMLRHVYRLTSLKLISWVEIPAGFTYLGESEALRHLTWAIVDALKRTAGRDVAARSAYILVFQKFAEAGEGFLEHRRVCSLCGAPDEAALSRRGNGEANPWRCSLCGSENLRPSSLRAVSLDEVEKTILAQWERDPETRPETLHQIVQERTAWAQRRDEDLRELDARYAALQAEFEQRGQWASDLTAEIEDRRNEVLELGARIAELERLLASPRRLLKHYLRKIWEKSSPGEE